MDKNEPTAFVYNIQRYCIHDGPGIRTTFFFKGCNMRCPWCANPESLSAKPQIAFFAARCTGCGACALVCETGAIDLHAPTRIDRSKCTLCGDCAAVCPADAYQLHGEERTLDELVTEAEKDRAFYRRSGGGVTISGGEPTMQAAFVAAFLAELKRRGIHTAMETNGAMAAQTLDSLLPVADLFLIDLKHMDAEKHKEFTGRGNAHTIENIRTAVQVGSVILRVPLIPRFNDDDENLAQTAEFALSLPGGMKAVHLLPFHAMAGSKYASLNMDYTYDDVQAQSEQRLDEILNHFISRGINAQIGG